MPVTAIQKLVAAPKCHRTHPTSAVLSDAWQLTSV